MGKKRQQKPSRFALETVIDDEDLNASSDEDALPFNEEFKFDSLGSDLSSGWKFGPGAKSLKASRMVRVDALNAAVRKTRERLGLDGEEDDEDTAPTAEDKKKKKTKSKQDKQDSDASEDNEEDSDEDDEVESENAGKSSKSAKQMETQSEEERLRKLEQQAEFFDDSFSLVSAGEDFASLHLSKALLKGIVACGFKSPTQIQRMCIPPALEGRDICAAAKTGSGKTAAFMLPVLERLQLRSRRVQATRVLVLTPTRELAAQIQSMTEALAKFTDVKCCLAIGGVSVQMQAAELRKRPDIVIGTPGRLIDHIRNAQGFSLEAVDVLILDEADRLLEMGFEAEVSEIVKNCPSSRQTMLLSATMTHEVDQLVKLSLRRPVRLNDNAAVRTDDQISSVEVPAALQQEFVRIREHQEAQRPALLLALLSRTFKKRVIVFTREKRTAHRLRLIIGLAGLRVAEIHGNLSQEQRMQALEDFRDGRADILIATDVAARGIDLPRVDTVINYEAPKVISEYVHRVGRTARAGRSGRAVTLADDSTKARAMIKEVIKSAKSPIKRRTVPQETIAHWVAQLKKYEPELEQLESDERMEREIRRVEMEEAKARNMINFQEDIMSRPKRTWFQTEAEKKQIKEDAAKLATEQADNGSDALRKMTDGDKYAGMSRGKKRKLQLDSMTDEQWQKKRAKQMSAKPLKKGDLKKIAHAKVKRPDRRPEGKKKSKPVGRKSFKSKAKHNRRK